MAKKQEMTPEQSAFLRRNRLEPGMWRVLQDYPQSMLIQRKDGTESKVLYKKNDGGWNG